jgi:LuxR family maltose regulon positive regulatory protein
MQLILEKITFPPEIAHLSRPRLRRVLRESLDTCASTVVNGRAGSGKTTLVADFAGSCNRETAWYKVDAPDSDLRVFLKYFIASIQQRRPDFGRKGLMTWVEGDFSDDFPLVAEALVYELIVTDGKPLLIVLEDLHLVGDAPWLVPFFGRLLPLLPADVHVVITSRTMPPAPLWRMRSKQVLCVIEEAELAFTQQEVIELFESCGLSREHAGLALKVTRGRASALNLLVAGLAKNKSIGRARTANAAYRSRSWDN